jgi:DNA polymerase type B, organellar and viral
MESHGNSLSRLRQFRNYVGNWLRQFQPPWQQDTEQHEQQEQRQRVNVPRQQRRLDEFLQRRAQQQTSAEPRQLRALPHRVQQQQRDEAGPSGMRPPVQASDSINGWQFEDTSSSASSSESDDSSGGESVCAERPVYMARGPPNVPLMQVGHRRAMRKGKSCTKGLRSERKKPEKRFNIRGSGNRSLTAKSKKPLLQFMRKRMSQNMRGAGGRSAHPISKEDLETQMTFIRNEKKRLNRAAKESAKESLPDDDEGEQPEPEFITDVVGERRIIPFNTTATEYMLRIRPPKTGKKLSFDGQLNRFKRIFQQIVDLVTEGMKPNDRIAFTFDHSSLDNPVHIPLMRVDQVNTGVVKQVIGKYLDSDKEFLLEGDLTVDVVRVTMPEARGGGFKRIDAKNYGHLKHTRGIRRDKFIRNKKSVIRIKNNDNLCLARALIVAKARAERKNSDEARRYYKNVGKNQGGTLTKKAKQLMIDARLDPVAKHIEYDNDWKMLCNALNKDWETNTDNPREEKVYYRVHVWNERDMSITKPYFTSDVPDSVKEEQYSKIENLHLSINLINKHVNVVGNIIAYASKNFCSICFECYNTKKHDCLKLCRACEVEGCLGKEDVSSLRLCEKCNREFHNEACFENHLKSGICERKFRCKYCEKTVDLSLRGKDNKVHVCGEIRCPTCEKIVDSNHKCYIKVEKNRFRNVITNVRVKSFVEDSDDDMDDFIVSDSESENNGPPENPSMKKTSIEEPMEEAEEEEDRKRPTVLYYVFFDTESKLRLLKRNPTPRYLHITNYVVSQTRCSYCETVDDPSEYAGTEEQEKEWRKECEPEDDWNSIVRLKDDLLGVYPNYWCVLGKHYMEQHYSGENPIANFYDDVFNLTIFDENDKKIPKRYVLAMAHNSRGYDSQFILDHMQKHGEAPMSQINRGLKIVTLQVNENLKFGDSYNFLAFKLAAFPKSFGFEDDLGKQYFPYMLNTDEHQDYNEQHLPPLEFYQPDMMMKGDRHKFLEWYEKNKNTPFCLKTALADYCRSDVTILRKGCIKYKEIIEEITNGINPYLVANTMAALTLFIFRNNYMPKNSMAIIDSNYGETDKHSCVSLLWLGWLNKPERKNGKIRTARHCGGEVAIPNPRPAVLDKNGILRKRPNLKFDGFCEETNTVYEFYGCRYHGCSKCYDISFVPHKKDSRRYPGKEPRTPCERYYDTMDRAKSIRSMGYELVEKWECEFWNDVRSNPELAAYVDKKKELIRPPMNPRDCVQGGRVEVFSMYYRCKAPTEQIHFVDVVSLYPHVMRANEFPIGHPVIITDNFSTHPTVDYFGIIHCTVLPPRNLMYPVLPYPARSKLFFPLCRSCVEDVDQKSNCQHNDPEERELTHTWSTPELKLAESKGYIITKIYEVYHFAERSKGLFKEHLDAFIKIKQESSGWPDAVIEGKQTQEEYIEEFFQHEGIRLDKSKIHKNEGMRSAAKIKLNALWGKFCQRPNDYREVRITNAGDFAKLLVDKTILIREISFPNDEVCVLKIKDKPGFSKPLDHINVVVAGFVTSYARIELYKYIDEVANDRRALYCDTDSLLYVEDAAKGHSTLPIGSFIGNLTDEVKKFGSDAYIRTWIAIAPKFYCYEVVDRKSGKVIKVPIKAKGVPLNYNVEKSVNFDMFESLVKNHYEEFKDLAPNQEVIDENLERVDPNDSIPHMTRARIQTVSYPQFTIRNDLSIVTGMRTKNIRCVFDKRQIECPEMPTEGEMVPNILSRAWGYIDEVSLLLQNNS